MLQDAEDDADKSDIILAVVGLSPDLEGEQMGVNLPGFSGGDRTGIDLPESQMALLKAMKAKNKPLIVVLTSGSAVAMNWAAENADAMLALWYGGEKSGTALAEVLSGGFSPSGKLPITFYRSLDGLPKFEDYSMKNRTYRYFKGDVLYPFGYGLSYASWKLNEAHLDRESIQAGESFHVEAEVINNSATPADQVLEVYIEPEGEHRDANPYLAGFSKIHLEAHQVMKVNLPIEGRQLSRVDDNGIRTVSQGQYRIFIGDGQPSHSSWDRMLKLTVKGQVAIPD
jgi:beta-glucosidase